MNIGDLSGRELKILKEDCISNDYLQSCKYSIFGKEGYSFFKLELL